MRTGQDLVLYGHGRRARTLLDRSLTDEIRLAIHSVLVGSAQVRSRAPRDVGRAARIPRRAAAVPEGITTL
ncbi:MAG: hypothetical protein ACJ79S_01905 [Gemmatimonadaceae bacterium]